MKLSTRWLIITVLAAGLMIAGILLIEYMPRFGVGLALLGTALFGTSLNQYFETKSKED